MLTGLENEIRELIRNDSPRFHKLVRTRIGKRATLVVENRLKEVILLMPTLLKRVRFHWDRQEDCEAKSLGSFVFAYVFNPDDFLSEKEMGLFGYLDDAYLIASVFERVSQNSHHRTKEDERYLKLIQATKKYVRAVIPVHSQLIDEMIAESIDSGTYTGFANALGRNAWVTAISSHRTEKAI